jgi:selenide,water dikinase
VFAVGDTGTIRGEELPKAGVYAVREGPVLWENIRRHLRGEALVDYVPQRRFLKLLNTGDGRAVVSYGSLGTSGRWCWRWKDRIDRRFMQMYQSYGVANMVPPSNDIAPDPMRCVGCGGKVPSLVLSNVLRKLEIPQHEAVQLGIDAADDVAVVSLPERRPLITTIDFFAPPIDDFYTAGRIALLNAASDLFAKGAYAVAALASITLPVGSQQAQERLLFELLSGALAELRAMRATLVGGHTLEGPRVTIGFTMFGDAHGRPLRVKSRLRPGDVLVLTKPLGTGVLLAAHAQAKCRAEWFDPLMSSMLTSNQQAAKLFDEFDVASATDVTGFGLAGHLHEMLAASRLDAHVALYSLPMLPGAAELFADGMESTMAPSNRQMEAHMDAPVALRQSPAFAALFDPQTSGGLLVGVSQDRAAPFVERLSGLVKQPVAIIGECKAFASEHESRIVLHE